jgi:hypothetical protein
MLTSTEFELLIVMPKFKDAALLLEYLNAISLAFVIIHIVKSIIWMQSRVQKIRNNRFFTNSL